MAPLPYPPLLLLVLVCLYVAQSTGFTYGDSQYIFYSGTVTGRICYDSTADPCANTTSLGTYAKSYLYVGRNPRWDPNPFWFELSHVASEDKDGIVSSSSGGNNRRRQVTLTYDNFYGLYFATAANDCDVEDSCSRDKGEALIDLKKTTVERVTLDPSEDPGYTVTGNQSSFEKLTDDAYNGVDLPDLSSQDFYLPAIRYEWNTVNPSTFSVTFSNNSAFASLTLQAQKNSLAFSFQGQRVSYPYLNEDDQSDYGHHASGLEGNSTIELDTSNPSLPQFRYTNGSQIYFQEDGDSWFATATPTPIPIPTPSASSTPTPSPTNAGSRGGDFSNGWLGVGSVVVVVFLVGYI